jgi:hypothetical protein
MLWLIRAAARPGACGEYADGHICSQLDYITRETGYWWRGTRAERWDKPGKLVQAPVSGTSVDARGSSGRWRHRAVAGFTADGGGARFERLEESKGNAMASAAWGGWWLPTTTWAVGRACWASLVSGLYITEANWAKELLNEEFLFIYFSLLLKRIKRRKNLVLLSLRSRGSAFLTRLPRLHPRLPRLHPWLHPSNPR